jgi:hypothetical protein
MGPASKILKPGGGKQLFNGCNVPLLVVVNTLLLVYIVLTVNISPLHRPESMLLVGSGATTKESSSGKCAS